MAKGNKLSNCLASIQIEDARQLSYEDNYADFIVLNGPLYHLTEESDRLQVLRECYRVLRPNGVILAFVIGRISGLMYSLNSGAVFHDDYFTMVKHEIITGVRSNAEGKNKTFLEAYFHNSKDLNHEMTICGFEVRKIKGVLGQAWNVQSLEDSILDGQRRKRLMEVARLMEEMPDFSPKILGIGIKLNTRGHS
jgi:ubiquinone/menaquinone biosynthesis C-methylase UbiE